MKTTKAIEPPATIIVDTREQEPWLFTARVRVARATLGTGDYSVLGLEGVVGIERKTREDFVNTMIHARDRFEAELRRFDRFRFAAVFVESDLAQIVRGEYRSAAAPRAVLASIASIMADFGVMVVFAGNRANAAAMAEDVLVRLKGRFAS